MTTETVSNPTSIPSNDVDQIKVNVNTGDFSLQNVAIPGRFNEKMS